MRIFYFVSEISDSKSQTVTSGINIVSDGAGWHLLRGWHLTGEIWVSFM